MSHMTKHPFFLAMAATAALALAACGSNDDNKSGSPQAKAEDKAFEGALKFAKCMREHGLDVPDPQRGPNGGIMQRMGREKGERIDEGKMEAAQKDCEHFMEAGGGEAPNPAEQAKRQDAFIAFAKCMRRHGVDMPDPKFEGNKVTMRAGGPGKGNGPDPESPTFKAAEKACHPQLAEVEGPMTKGKP
jgi:hypothetical protein